jgi:inorganic pyrophosphatase/exopolyphosphatase
MFLDEFKYWSDARHGGRIFLVDHNRLSPNQITLKERVIGVIDHHVDEGIVYPSSISMSPTLIDITKQVISRAPML